MNLFQLALKKENSGRPPVWLMRQAGRYHSHYQKIRAKHSFIEMCKNADLATEITLGPIQDFDFDAAILFSDLLFPLEGLGMGLDYKPGPVLGWYLSTRDEIQKLNSQASARDWVGYQKKALIQIRNRLNTSKGLLGFVGGPLTLYFYAVAGSHQLQENDRRKLVHEGIKNGLFADFCNVLRPFLVENLVLQAEGGPDTIAVLDTCAGEVEESVYVNQVLPEMRLIFDEYSKRAQVPLILYTKDTGPILWRKFDDLKIAGIGVDWHHPISDVLTEFSDRFAIQGNFEPELMLLPKAECETHLRKFFEQAASLPQKFRKGWICGLGHGVLQTTPEENVRLFVALQREYFK